MQDNRRRENRAEIELEIDLGAYGQYALSRLVNVSIGGAFVRSRVLHEGGTSVTLRFALPGNSELIHIEGEVVWTYDQRGETDVNASGLGIAFKKIDPQDQQRIQQYVQSALQQ